VKALCGIEEAQTNFAKGRYNSKGQRERIERVQETLQGNFKGKCIVKLSPFLRPESDRF